MHLYPPKTTLSMLGGYAIYYANPLALFNMYFYWSSEGDCSV